MKNFKVLFLSVVAASFLTACNDAIDITQPSELTPERTYQTVNDLQLGLNGVYSYVPGENHILFTSLFTDEVKLGRSNGGQGRDGSLAFVLNANSGDAASIWISNYGLINQVNRLLVGAENVTPAEGEEQLYNSILAQAHALRAFGHFQLLEFFSTDLTDDTALGVPAIDYVTSVTDQPARNTNGEVFALIESDLAFAEENLTDADVNAVYTNRGGFTTGALNALRARMYVFREQYDLATEALNNFTSFPLTNKTTYPNMFLDTSTGEVIWKLRRTTSGSTGNFYQYWSSVNSSTTGSPFFEVATALYNELAAYGTSGLNADVRLNVVIDASAAPSYAIRPVGKYSASYNINLNGDIKVFRNSEMRLLQAEIAAAAGDFVTVADRVGVVRRARTSNSVTVAPPASAQEAWKLILDERRLEFAFEGFRYLDIKRLKDKAGVTVDRATSDFTWNNAYDLPADDHRWTLPIPRAEMSANSAMQQNPGY